jgi:hypothetical protein
MNRLRRPRNIQLLTELVRTGTRLLPPSRAENTPRVASQIVISRIISLPTRAVGLTPFG